MFLKLFVLAFAVSCAIAHNAAHTECVNTTTFCKDLVMQVSECNAEHERCPLYQGKSHTVTFECTPTKNFTGKTDFRVYGVFEKFSVPYRGKSDACESAVTTDTNTPCKDMGGFFQERRFRHESNFAVSVNYPKIQLKVRFSMCDRRSKVCMMCAELPVEIMSPPGE
ncbi:uncharacterized protein [Parasteatoda tepidariorum]|uniref:uncharacterized protein isoform X1 n=1 Tax=Parasteatoda tepidariorum TaxID=114398 RepID=UPI00077F8E4A|nr:uncharacterized protein LOC107448180 [Parasteatoda tepidariorum]